MPRRRVNWPEWWTWEIEPSAHLERRQDDRHFTEVDLRRMLQIATGFRRDVLEGRWIITSRHRRALWEIVVEPEFEREILVVVTAYEVTPT